MPRDYKKMFLEEENKNLKIEKELVNIKNQVEELKNNQSVMSTFSPQNSQDPQQPQNPQLSKSFENDIKYIVELSQRMSTLLKDCRRYMLPMELGKKIDSVLKEIDRM